MNQPLYFALVGKDIEYSRSPEIFEAIYNHLGRSGRFEIHSVRAGELQARIRQAVLEGVSGFSVTIPFKQEIIQYLDDIDPTARAVNAVNSVAVEEDRLLGYNTDCHGFSQPLNSYRPLLKSGRAMILGSGGGARAAIHSLRRDFDMRSFVVVTRSVDKIDALKRLFESETNPPEIIARQVPLKTGSLPGDVTIAVNCTPLAGWNSPDKSPLPKSFDFGALDIYYDLNYNENNQTLAAARRAGTTTVDGSAMLVSQAIRSFDIWTGQSVPFEPIFEAVFGSGKRTESGS